MQSDKAKTLFCTFEKWDTQKVTGLSFLFIWYSGVYITISFYDIEYQYVQIIYLIIDLQYKYHTYSNEIALS